VGQPTQSRDHHLGWDTVDPLPNYVANREIFSGWKDIANYLGKGVRTVQRYEKELMLPVRRPSGSRGSVLATKAELDRWVLSASIRETPSRFEIQRLRQTIQQMRNIETEAKHLISQINQLRQSFAKHLPDKASWQGKVS
jgi:hypothetical protein